MFPDRGVRVMILSTNPPTLDGKTFYMGRVTQQDIYIKDGLVCQQMMVNMIATISHPMKARVLALHRWSLYVGCCASPCTDRRWEAFPPGQSGE